VKKSHERLRSVATGVVWLLVAGFVLYRAAPQLSAAAGIGGGTSAAPELAGHTIDDVPFSLAGYRGQVVLVNFWATWCPPCRVEMPGFQRVYEDRRQDGFVVLGLSTDVSGVAPVRAFIEERGITFPVAMAGSEARAAFGPVRALPTSFLIDRQGRVRHEVAGLFAEPALRAAVDRLLEEPVPTAGERLDG